MTGFTGHTWSSARRNAPGWDEHRKAKLTEMWNRGDRVADIADALSTSRGGIYVQANKMGLRRRAERAGRPRTSAKVHHRNDQGARRHLSYEAKGVSRVVLQPHHPASREGSTIFPGSVIPAGELVRLLKSGDNSRKTGGMVTKGRYRGLPIYTLTLEERETCPRTCEQWSSCYGNGMHWAQRIADDGTLIRRLWAELAVLNAEHKQGYLVRLHVLGDFYSVDYVNLWRQAMQDFPKLVVFGFTARQPPDPIGVAVAELTGDFYDRFRIRFSGLRMEQDGAIVVDRLEDAIGILCPAERDQARCCGSCGLCWHTNKTISFLRH